MDAFYKYKRVFYRDHIRDKRLKSLFTEGNHIKDKNGMELELIIRRSMS